MTADAERLSPKAIRALNDTLAPLGLRVCRVCQGHPLPLTDDNFYRVGKGHPRFQTICKACHNAKAYQARRKRYTTDADSHARLNAQMLSWKQAHRERARQISRASKRRRKAANFARVLGQHRD